MVLVLLEALLAAGVLAVVVAVALPEVDGVGERSEADEYPLDAEDRAGEGSAWGTRIVRGALFS